MKTPIKSVPFNQRHWAKDWRADWGPIHEGAFRDFRWRDEPVIYEEPRWRNEPVFIEEPRWRPEPRFRNEPVFIEEPRWRPEPVYVDDRYTGWYDAPKANPQPAATQNTAKPSGTTPASTTGGTNTQPAAKPADKPADKPASTTPAQPADFFYRPKFQK